MVSQGRPADGGPHPGLALLRDRHRDVRSRQGSSGARAVSTGKMPFASAPKHVLPLTLVSSAAVLALLFGWNYDWRQSTINTLVAIVIALSLVVLTGFVGQISLAQMAIAGTAGFFMSKYFSGLPFPLAPVVGLWWRRCSGRSSPFRAPTTRGEPGRHHALGCIGHRATRLQEQDLRR